MTSPVAPTPRHAVAEHRQRVLQMLHGRLLEVALSGSLGQREVVGHVRVTHQLLRQLRARCGSAAAKFDGAEPTRSASRLATWRVITSRDSPCSPAASAFESRSCRVLRLPSRTST